MMSLFLHQTILYAWIKWLAKHWQSARYGAKRPQPIFVNYGICGKDHEIKDLSTALGIILSFTFSYPFNNTFLFSFNCKNFYTPSPATRETLFFWQAFRKEKPDRSLRIYE